MWSIIFKIITFLGTLGVFAHAEPITKPVTLVIWVYERNAFSLLDRDFFLQQLAEFQPNSETRILELNIHETNPTLAQVLKTTDRIDHLIIATHGNTDKKTNATILKGLGGFNSQGSFGEFKKLLHDLEGRFTSDLRVTLNACSTFCGSEEGIKERNLGLANELQKLGVNKLSIWGARQSLVSEVSKLFIAMRMYPVEILKRIMFYNEIKTFLLNQTLKSRVITGTASLSAITLVGAVSNQVFGLDSAAYCKIVGICGLTYGGAAVIDTFHWLRSRGYSVVVSGSHVEIKSESNPYHEYGPATCNLLLKKILWPFSELSNK